MLLAMMVVLLPGVLAAEPCTDISQDCALLAAGCAAGGPNEHLLRINCPATCRLCSSTHREQQTPRLRFHKKTQRDCVDAVDDCDTRRNFCRRSHYRRMMTLQCAKTCNLCHKRPIEPEVEEVTEQPTSSEIEETEEGTLVDENRLHSLAILKSHLKRSTLDLLKREGVLDELIELIASVTTKYVTPSIRASTTRPATLVAPQSATTTSTTTISPVCFDRAPDCAGKLALCHHSAYAKLVRRLCARTCSLCATFSDT